MQHYNSVHKVHDQFSNQTDTLIKCSSTKKRKNYQFPDSEILVTCDDVSHVTTVCVYTLHMPMFDASAPS